MEATMSCKHEWRVPSGPGDKAIRCYCSKCHIYVQYYLAGRVIEPGDYLYAQWEDTWHHVSFDYVKDTSVTENEPELVHEYEDTWECSACNGTGETYSSVGLPDRACDSCDGIGKVASTTSITKPLSSAMCLRWKTKSAN
jgi:hypothetical protein